MGAALVRRLLSLGLAEALLASSPVQAQTDDAALFAAGQVAVAEQVAAVNEAADRFGASGDPLGFQLIEQATDRALDVMDDMDMPLCARPWWATVRSTFAVYIEALQIVRAGGDQNEALTLLQAVHPLMVLAKRMESEVAC